MGLLEGKVVVVTGGGHGIGRAYCLGIAREGGITAVADIDEKAADGVAKAIADSGGKAVAIEADRPVQAEIQGRKLALRAHTPAI